MKIIVIGSGGRENILVEKLSTCYNSIYCIGEYINPDIKAATQEYFTCSLKNTDALLTICSKVEPHMIIIGPETLLETNFVNECKLRKYPCIAPYKELAQLETSKIFTRYLLETIFKMCYNPQFRYLHKSKSKNEIKNTINSFVDTNKVDIVIKVDGLAGGKGVFVQGDHFNTLDEGFDIICNKLQDKNILIEEKLIGEEFSLFTLSDGDHFVHLPPVQDFKRAYNNNKGPNTGGMGSIMHQFDFLTDNDISECETLNANVLMSLKHKYNKPYIGVLYGSYMKTTKNKIKLIEYNCRFGDSEVFNILNAIQTDLTTIFHHMINKTLHKVNIKIDSKPNIVKYLVPQGYPEKPIKSEIIYVKQNNIYAASLNHDCYSLGSRCIAVYADGETLNDAYNKCESLIDEIQQKNENKLYWRSDIGDYKLLTYESSGVDVDKGNRFVKEIKQDVESTYNNNVLGKHGNFGGQYQFKDNVLVTSTDGVGTKGIIIKKYTNNYYTCGHDIVNHSINDILVQGAKPLFFLDYIASGKLDIEDSASFVKGCCDACKKVDCPLLGGETAEMPSVYNSGHMDMVGTIVGEKVINIEEMNENDIAIGFPSSGPHTNGYTLIRKIMEKRIPPKHILQTLLEPHRSYLNEIIEMNKNNIITGMCHITGGGLTDNLKRIVADNLKLDLNSIMYPEWCNWLQMNGNLTHEEMHKTFNCGVGYITFIKPITRPNPLRICVMGSTKGTVLDAIVNSINETNSILHNKIEIVNVISNKEKSGILDRAKSHGLNTCYKKMDSKLVSKTEYYNKLSEQLEEDDVDYILCIGWMSICPPTFISKWENRCINVHPSLLPKFSGKMNMDVHEEVLQSGEKETGCTVHIMTNEVDKGSIIIQKKCEVKSNDTPELLKQRVQDLEGTALTETLYYAYNNLLVNMENKKFIGIVKSIEI